MVSCAVPHLLIFAGPTGAGKTRTASWLMRQTDVSRPVHVRVDDLVQADPGYADQMRELLRESRHQKYIDALYFRIRDHDGCVREQDNLSAVFQSLPKDMRDTLQGGGCSAVANAAVAKALLNREHIVFETTGHTYPDWIVSLARRRGYRVVLCYTLAPFQTLLQRNRSRMRESIDTFEIEGNNRAAPMAPRMPDLTPHIFHARMTRVHDELLRIVRDGVVGCDRAECVDELVVVSNQRRLRLRLRWDRETTLKERRVAARGVLRLLATYE